MTRAWAERQPLQHPLAERQDWLGGAVRQAELIEQLRDAPGQQAFGDQGHRAVEPQQRRGVEVLRKCLAFVQVADLGQRAAVLGRMPEPKNGARGGPADRQQRLDQGGLARPIGPKNAERRAARDVERRLPQGMDAFPAEQAGAIDFRDSLELDVKPRHVSSS